MKFFLLLIFFKILFTLCFCVPLAMSWYLYLALKYLFPSGKKFSFLPIVSIFGVSIGVLILFVVSSVMNGFQSEICSKIVNTQGQVRIDSTGIIHHSSKIRDFLLGRCGVDAVSRYVIGALMLQFKNCAAYPIVKGVDIVDEAQVLPLDNFIKRGTLENVDDFSLILSSGLAASLGASAGDSVDVYSPHMLQSFQEKEIMLPQSLKIAAIYSSGWSQADENSLIIPLGRMQELYEMSRDDCHGFTLKLRNGVNVDHFVHELRNELPNLRILGWHEINGDFMFILKLEKTMMMFVLLFILLTAAFSIASSTMISIVKKRREIGLLCAFGATSREISTVFILESLIVGVVGSIFGLFFGVIVLHFRNTILSILTKITGINDFMLNFYGVAQLPVKYSLGGVVTIVGFTMIICYLAGLIPSLCVAKIKPSDALRNE